MMDTKILIMGLPGAGKTTLARELAPLLNAVLFNADEVRANINRDLGFSLPDRIEQARRMGWLCDQVVNAGGTAIADFVCPTPETRTAFGEAFTIWVDRIDESRFSDTNTLFQSPTSVDIRVTPNGTARYWAEQALRKLRPVFNPSLPTALFVGRYQPFHDGHKALIEEGIRRVGQACLAVRQTHKLDESNPLSFHDVQQRIEAGLNHYRGRYTVISIPDVSHIFYGRDVGYVVERIDLAEGALNISATAIRQHLVKQ